jgi:arabinogalactan endo-1,4-beta-galactosidase
LASVIASVAGAPKGIGVVYWEPDWIPQKGAGWRAGEGNSWENQALFDFKGRALSSLKTFALVSAKGEMPDINVTSIAPVSLKVAVGAVLALPKNVLATYSDDSYRLTQVIWKLPEADALKKVGKLEVKGSVWGYSRAVVAWVEVVANANLVADASFESGKLGPEWKLEGTGMAAAAPVEKNPGNAHSGDWSFKYWLDKPFKFTLSHKFSDLKDGDYALRVWAAGGGGETSYALFARDYGGPALSAPIVNSGWQKWKLYEIKGIAVKGGSCAIGLEMDGGAGNWGNADDFEFILDSK